MNMLSASAENLLRTICNALFESSSTRNCGEIMNRRSSEMFCAISMGTPNAVMFQTTLWAMFGLFTVCWTRLTEKKPAVSFLALIMIMFAIVCSTALVASFLVDCYTAPSAATGLQVPDNIIKIFGKDFLITVAITEAPKRMSTANFTTMPSHTRASNAPKRTYQKMAPFRKMVLLSQCNIVISCQICYLVPVLDRPG